MLFNYKEVIAKYKTDYKLQQAILKKEIYKIEKGIYSDGSTNFTDYELLLKKYPNALLVKDSALHFIKFSNEKPKKVHLGTARNALRIKDKRVQQHFYKGLNYEVGQNNDLHNNHGENGELWDEFLYDKSVENATINIRKYTTENGNEIRLFDLKSLLLDLLRSRKKYDKEKLFSLLYKFRDCKVVIGLKLFDEGYENLIIEGDYELFDLLEEIKRRDWERRFDYYLYD